MNRLGTVGELTDFRQRILSEKVSELTKPTLVICAGTGGQASGSNDVMRVIKRYVIERAMQEKVAIRVTGCQGFCEMDPFILVEPGHHLYPKLSMDDVPRVIEAAVGGFIDEGLIYKDTHEQRKYFCQNDIPFFQKQTRTILGNNEKLDPIRILSYVECGGYAAVEKVLARLNPEWIINEVQGVNRVVYDISSKPPSTIEWE